MEICITSKSAGSISVKIYTSFPIKTETRVQRQFPVETETWSFYSALAQRQQHHSKERDIASVNHLTIYGSLPDTGFNFILSTNIKRSKFTQ